MTATRTPGESLADTVIAAEQWDLSPVARAAMVVAFGEAIDLSVKAATTKERDACVRAVGRTRTWLEARAALRKRASKTARRSA